MMQSCIHWRALGFIVGFSCIGPSAFADEGGNTNQGQQVYQQICQYCHETGIGPKITERQLPGSYTRFVVRNGLRAMPAFRTTEVSETEIAAVAAFVEGMSQGGSR